MKSPIDTQVENLIKLTTSTGQAFKKGFITEKDSLSVLSDIDRHLLSLPSNPQDRIQSELFRFAHEHANKVRSEISYRPGWIIAKPLR